jgi:hypothetical protein
LTRGLADPDPYQSTFGKEILPSSTTHEDLDLPVTVPNPQEEEEEEGLVEV